MTVSVLENLVQSLRCLPGVGPKSAQRMAYHLLQRERKGALQLADALSSALANLHQCEQCNNYAEQPVCDVCASEQRDSAQLCIVESPVDMNMMEQTQAYGGLYYVLMGRLSPLDGIGPKELSMERLLQRACNGLVQEVILATNFTNEGEATAFYLTTQLEQRGVTVSRIARGVPVGGELEFVDSGTLAQAVRERRYL